MKRLLASFLVATIVIALLGTAAPSIQASSDNSTVGFSSSNSLGGAFGLSLEQIRKAEGADDGEGTPSDGTGNQSNNGGNGTATVTAGPSDDAADGFTPYRWASQNEDCAYVQGNMTPDQNEQELMPGPYQYCRNRWAAAAPPPDDEQTATETPGNNTNSTSRSAASTRGSPANASTGPSGIDRPITRFGIPIVIAGILGMLLLRRVSIGRFFGGGRGQEASTPTPSSTRPDTGENDVSSEPIEADGWTAGNEVYRVWHQLLDHLDLPDRETRTPAEIAQAASERGVGTDDVTALADLFASVRYGPDNVTQENETRAASLFHRIVGDETN